jgi:hypothetical protein
MQTTLNTFALTLAEGVVCLYPANADGSANTASPIWTGAPAENLTVRERWVKVETRPSGARYPRNHPLIPKYEVSIARVWVLQELNPAGLVTSYNEYVLDIVWTDEDTGDWHRETLYNVTISERSRASRNIDEGFTDELMFDAEYMTPPQGGTGSAPTITSTVPMVVQWVGPDGTFPLYTYDSTSHNFTEAVAGISAERAVLAYNPTNQSGVFTAQFNGSMAAALEVAANGGLDVTEIYQGAPDLTQVPRLDFMVGNLRVASLTSAGRLYAASFEDGTPEAGTGLFEIYCGAGLALTIGAAGVVADYYYE